MNLLRRRQAFKDHPTWDKPDGGRRVHEASSVRGGFLSVGFVSRGGAPRRASLRGGCGPFCLVASRLPSWRILHGHHLPNSPMPRAFSQRVAKLELVGADARASFVAQKLAQNHPEGPISGPSPSITFSKLISALDVFEYSTPAKYLSSELLCYR